MPLWFYDLAIYSAQLAILVLAAGLMAWSTGLRMPRARLFYWQAVLFLGLMLPVIQPWRSEPTTAPSVQVFEAAVPSRGAEAGPNSLPSLPPAHPISPYEIIAIALAVGLLLRLIWITVGMVRLRRSCRVARPLGSNAAAEELKQAMGVFPAVLVTDRLGSPATFGWRSASVLLPAGFAAMDEGRQRAILCHELLHVRRRDWRWHIAEELLSAFFWFHVAVTWLIGQVRLSREQLVDQEVVAITGSRRDYLDALFEAAAISSQPSPAPPFLRKRHLKRRVAYLMKEAAMSRKKLVAALIASFGALFISSFLSVTLLPLKTKAAERQAAQPENSRYLKWVNGPVRYIMTGQERAAFEKLTSDSERNKFVAQFWERRNPSPGSPENAFKTDFYRRVAYTNGHFSAGIPGWMTDRGEIYIRYGPPDQIIWKRSFYSGPVWFETWKNGHLISKGYSPGQAAPKPSAETPPKPYPYQVWTWRNVPGIGHNVAVTFIDKYGTGDYQLAPGKPSDPPDPRLPPSAADPPAGQRLHQRTGITGGVGSSSAADIPGGVSGGVPGGQGGGIQGGAPSGVAGSVRSLPGHP